MNLEIYNSKTQPEQKPILLKLTKAKNGIINLIVVDEDGYRRLEGDLLYIYPNGTMGFGRNINPAFGFQLDDRGCLNIKDCPDLSGFAIETLKDTKEQ